MAERQLLLRKGRQKVEEPVLSFYNHACDLSKGIRIEDT